jgi:hypothetical protein
VPEIDESAIPPVPEEIVDAPMTTSDGQAGEAPSS